MDTEKLNHFNLLSEKIIGDEANEDEIKEFHLLLTEWNCATKLNLIAKKPLSPQN